MIVKNSEHLIVKTCKANVTTHHASMAVNPSAFGVLVVTVLKMFTNTRKRVTRRAIRPKKRISLLSEKWNNYVQKSSKG